MKITCNNCRLEMKKVKDKERFITVYRCSKCGCEVTVNWEEEGYEIIEEYPR